MKKELQLNTTQELEPNTTLELQFNITPKYPMIQKLPILLEREWDEVIKTTNFVEAYKCYRDEQQQNNTLGLSALVTAIQLLINPIKEKKIIVTTEMVKYISTQLSEEISKKPLDDKYQMANDLVTIFYKSASLQNLLAKRLHLLQEQKQKYEELASGSFWGQVKYSEYSPFVFFRKYRTPIATISLITLNWGLVISLGNFLLHPEDQNAGKKQNFYYLMNGMVIGYLLRALTKSKTISTESIDTLNRNINLIKDELDNLETNNTLMNKP